jgi:hypothetical protein
VQRYINNKKCGKLKINQVKRLNFNNKKPDSKSMSICSNSKESDSKPNPIFSRAKKK